MSKLLGMLALGAGSLLPMHIARAGDVVAPKEEKRAPQFSLTSRNYSDKLGYITQNFLEGDFGKIAYLETSPVVKIGADLKLGDIFKDGGAYRLNLGRITDESTDHTDSRALIEGSYKGGALDFWNAEYQEVDGKGIYAGALGLRFDRLKVQGTANSSGDYGYGLMFKVEDNANIGVGGRHTKDKDIFDAAFDYKFTDSALEGYSLKGHFKYTDRNSGNDTLEARIKFGEKPAGGAFLVGVQDTLFNTTTTVDDVTFPFDIGKFDLFGAADSITGKAGRFGADIKYKDNGTDRFLDANAAVGLGSLDERFFKNVKLQAGYKMYFDDSSKDMFSAELRTKLYESKDGNFSLEGGYRYENPAIGDDDHSFFIGGSWKF